MHEHRAVLRQASRVVSPVVLASLLCADVAFFLLHVSNRLSPRNVLFSLATDGGYAEAFQYLKEYWIALALLAACWRTREGTYGAWALLFTYVLCDDALTIHETVGEVVATHWAYVPGLGLRAKDFGELTVSALAGSVALVCIRYFHVRGSNYARNVSRDLALLLVVLVFFGIFLDMVHLAVEGMGVRALTIVEDGGEMVTMSLIASYVVHLVEQREHDAGLLWRLTVAALTGRST